MPEVMGHSSSAYMMISVDPRPGRVSISFEKFFHGTITRVLDSSAVSGVELGKYVATEIKEGTKFWRHCLLTSLKSK
jgi:hypothetical protein